MCIYVCMYEYINVCMYICMVIYVCLKTESWDMAPHGCIWYDQGVIIKTARHLDKWANGQMGKGAKGQTGKRANGQMASVHVFNGATSALETFCVIHLRRKVLFDGWWC